MTSGKKWYYAVVVGMFIAGLSNPAVVVAFNLNDGEWELTHTYKSAYHSGKPETTTECLTKAEFMKKEEEPGCTVEQKVSGNTFSYHSKCTSGDNAGVETYAEQTFSGNSMKGTIRTTGPGPDGKPVKMTGTITGRRIGPCKNQGK